MTIKTISNLRSIDSTYSTDLLCCEIGLSRCVDAASRKYESVKAGYTSLSGAMVSAVRKAFTPANQMTAFTDIKNINNKLNTINKALSVDTSLSVATFYYAPKSKSAVNSDDLKDNDIPNKVQVKDIVTKRSAYIAPYSYVKPNIENANGQTKMPTVDQQSFYQWHIDEGQRDSEQYIDPETGSGDVVTVNETGNLVVYGWFASNSIVQAQEAWVGLFGKIHVGNSNNEKWIALQVQPWVVGSNSQILQYVGFNIPVMKGLQLKVMTGFPVNGTNSGTQRGNTLLFKSEGNIINTCVGYVVSNE